MKILVIIVTYNAMQWVERCFKSLRESTEKPDVFVVDNGSTDGTQAYIQEHYPEVMFQQSETNLGFGKANNLGLQYALDNDYNYVYLLNQDAWVMEDTFEKLIEISKKNPEYGILSPFQMNADMYHVDQNFVSGSCSWKSNSDIFNDLYNINLNEIYPVKRVMAAHWFVTRDCLLKVGGFSPSFPHYGEDYNYIDRAHFFNFKIGIVPSLRVVHDRGDRKMTSSVKIYLGYISAICSCSNPQMSFTKAQIRAIYVNIRSIYETRSFKPIFKIFKIFIQISKIYRNRRISMIQQKAFLN